jgi:hypothetical protein
MEKLRIVIVDNRGLTFIGRCDLDGDNEIITIKDARCIIYWGTSEHISELVDGPTSNTKLGRTHDVSVFRKNLVLSYEVDEKAWESKL